MIAKFGSKSDRWGQFMFMCDHCSKKIHSLREAVKTTDSSCNNALTSVDSTVIDTSNASTDTCDFPHNLNNVDSGSEGLLIEVSNKVKSILSDFESDLMSKVDKLLGERIPVPNPVPADVQLSPSNSETLSYDSTESSMVTNKPQAVNAGFGSKLYLDAFLETPQKDSTIDSYLSHEKKSTICTPENTSIRFSKAQEDHVIVLDGTSDGEKVDMDKVESSIGSALKNVPMNYLRTNKKSNKIVISFPTDADKENGKTVLAATTEINSLNVKVQEAKKMLPKVTVTNIPNSLLSSLHGDKPSLSLIDYRAKVKELLETKFLEKNSEIQNLVTKQGQMFKIVFVKTGRDSTTVGIKVSAVIRDFLISRSRIYIGNTSCKVSDRFDIRQCFHCQQLGHISSNCKEPDPVCMYCGASHKTVDCNVKYDESCHTCVNCSHSKDRALQNSCGTHHSGSDSCPIIVTEKQNIRKRTEYSKNV
jgi:hypothetical protein